MNSEDWLNALRDMVGKRVEQLDENTQKLFYAVMDIADQRDELKLKYNEVLKMLAEYCPPCELDGFMDKNTDYCSLNCGVDEEIFKECWDRYITQRMEGKDE